MKKLSLLAFAIFLFSIGQAHADILQPRAEVNVRAGTERSILMTEFWAPLAQQSDRVLYGDLRLMGDNDENREGNLGIGYRQIVPKYNSVLGANAWIDRRRTELGNNFHQITLGVESLGETIDLRANAYIQLNSSKTTITPNIGSTTPYLAGSNIFYDTNGFIVEEPQDGFDAEIGYRIPVFQKYIDTTRVYAGGYHFIGDTTDNVTGFRLRTEAQVNSIFSVGARFQHDGPRGSQGFLEATLRFPFKSKKLFQEHGLHSRLDESPERDIDIVTGSKVDTGLRKPFLNASGTEQRILYVDNTAQPNGTGTKENPFNTLAAAQAALQANDIVYINRGDGTTTGMDNGIVIDKADVQLIGSGSALTYAGYTLLSAGQAPIITNTQTRIDDYTGNGVFVIADNALISGITVTGAKGHGIAVRAENAAWSSTTITNNTSIANTWYGVRVIAATAGYIGNIEVNGNTLSNSITRGGAIVSAEGGNIGTASIKNNIASGNTTHGLFLQAASLSSINSLVLENNIANSNTQSGIFAVATGGSGALITTINANNNYTSANGANGLFVQAVTNSSINNIIIDKHVSTNNAHTGIYVQITSASRVDSLKLRDSISNNNTGSNGYGIWVQANGINSTITNAEITRNVTNNNSTTGLVFHAGGGIINAGTLEHNISKNNLGNGFYLYSQTSTSILNNVTFSFNDAIGNSIHGAYLRQADPLAVYLVDLGGGSLSSAGQNRIFGNTGNDLNIERATISAGSNWWNNGGLAPTRVTLSNGGSATYTPPLATDPRP